MTVKRRFLERLALLAAAVCCGWGPMGAQAADHPPEQLALSDLADHPERWPDMVRLKGDALELVDFDGANVTLVSKAGQQISVSAGDCDLLEAANGAWSKLTPAQRVIDLEAIAADMSLWPSKAVMRMPILRKDGLNVPAGTVCTLAEVTDEGVKLIASLSKPGYFHELPPPYASPFTAGRREPAKLVRFKALAQQTDLIARARERAALPPEQRPSRIAAIFKGLAVVDAKGRPYAGSALDDATIYVLYCGASWCHPCREFSPSFVQFINEKSAANPHMAAVMLNDDKNTPDMLAYMQAERMPFPSIPVAGWQFNYTLDSYMRGGIPHVVVIDRNGKVLADTYENNVYVGPDKTLYELNQILNAGAAR